MTSGLFAQPNSSTPLSGDRGHSRRSLRRHLLGTLSRHTSTPASPSENVSTHSFLTDRGTSGRVGTLTGRVLKFRRSEGGYFDVCKHLGIPDPSIAG